MISGVGGQEIKELVVEGQEIKELVVGGQEIKELVVEGQQGRWLELVESEVDKLLVAGKIIFE